MTDQTMTLDDHLCFALYSANHAMGRLYRPLLSKLGLTYPQYLVLIALWDQDARKVNDLGADLSLESNTLTPLLKRMEAGGLVVRRRNPKDERSVIVSLTDLGRALEVQSAEISRCILETAGNDAKELIDLRDRIRVLADRLRAAG